MNKYIILIVAILGLSACKDNRSKTGNPLEVGYQNSPIAALLMVANDNHYFDSVGVKVNMRSYTAGKFAVADLISGKGLDVALSGELPIVYTRLQGYDTRIISQVVERTINECRIIAKKDGDITTAEQYFAKKRTLATSKKGTPEYFLQLYMKRHNLDTNTVKIIGMKPEDMTAGLLNNQVDAICIFDPVAAIATQKMEGNGIVFTDSNMYSALYIVSVLQKTLDTRKDDLQKFLKALNMAADYCKSHPNESKKIVAKYTTLDPSIVDALWNNYVFDLALTNNLPSYLQDEAFWAKNSGDTTYTAPVPDFKNDVVDTSILTNVAPHKIILH